jgi:dethiobiotin synthetase
MAGFFITGTDTGIGKTWVAIALMRYLRQQGLSVLGMKPVACGTDVLAGETRNEDVVLLMENSSLQIGYKKLNVYTFDVPVSPHLAAKIAGQSIELELIVRQCRELEQLADYVIVEGIGGWEVPLSDKDRVSSLAKALNLPVILVVGMRLGCLNHALLTHEAILRSGQPCAGWIANGVEKDFARLTENLETLNAQLSSPFLGSLAHCDMADGKPMAGEGFKPACREEFLLTLTL